MRFLLPLLLLLGFAQAQDISITATSDQSQYAIGDTITLALVITIPEAHHLYANPLGPGVGKPLAITPHLSDNITWLDGLSDQPEKYEQEGDTWVWQWDNSVNIFVRGILTTGSTDSIPLSIDVNGLICKTACLPQNQTINTRIFNGKASQDKHFTSAPELQLAYSSAKQFPIEEAVVADNYLPEFSFTSNNEVLPSTWDYKIREASDVAAGKTEKSELNLGMAIFLAFIAGIILNFMPCVLPVLGIKILSFSEGRTGSKAMALKNSFAFAGGMILVFLLLGALAAFAGMSWGQQFQNPIFTIVLIALMFAFGLGMFDLFIILVPNKIAEMDMKQDSHSIAGNFGKGIFATLLATPCSGPFLGATLAWTVTQPKPVVFAVFLALGIGMASPYILLAASERLSKIIPKPGAWMEDFKHILGFFLFGFAVYLMIGLPQELVLPTVAFLVVLSGAIILYGKLAPFGTAVPKKIFAIVVVLLVLFGGYKVSFENIKTAVTPHENSGNWQKFSVELLEQAHADGQDVLLDFTALWCMNCQFNKKTVYYTAAMDSIIAEKEILTLKADLTQSNPELETLRSKLGSESIPFLVLFPADNPEEPIVFRDIVTKEQLFSQLKKLY